MTESLPCVSRRALLGSVALAAAAGVRAQEPRAGESRRTPRPGGRFDVERFVAECRAAVLERDAQSAVQEAMRRALHRADAVRAALGEPQQAGIETLYRSAELTILNIVWAPLMQLMPHEHNMWALIGIYAGREDNIFWQREDGKIAASGAAALMEGSVRSLPKDVIHSVANPVEAFTGAIHVYGGDFFAVPRSEWSPDSLDEYPWDIDKAMRLFEESNERFLAFRRARECVEP